MSRQILRHGGFLGRPPILSEIGKLGSLLLANEILTSCRSELSFSMPKCSHVPFSRHPADPTS